MKRTKRLAAAALAVVMAAGLAGCGDKTGKTAESDNKLVVANWQSYGSDQDYGAKAFEALYGCEVEHYYINSIPELLQTLQNGGAGEIDVVCINPLYIQEYYKAGMLEPIDTDKLSSYGDLMPSFAGIDEVKDDSGNVLGVPWVWGSTALAYNGDVIGREITSWADLWSGEFAGSVGFFDEYYTAVQTAAMYLGEDPYDPDLDKVKEALLDLKKDAKTFWGVNDDFVKGYTSGELTIGNCWSGIATQLYTEGQNIQYVYPEEGSVAWCDYWCIVKGTGESDLAMKWIDFCTSQDFQTALASSGVHANAPTNTKVIANLSDDVKKALWIYPEAPDNVVLSLPQTTEQMTAWMNLWNDVKAAN